MRLPLSARIFSSRVLVGVGSNERVAGDDVVDRPRCNVEYRDEVFSLRRGGNDVLVRQHTEVGVLAEHGLQY